MKRTAVFAPLLALLLAAPSARAGEWERFDAKQQYGVRVTWLDDYSGAWVTGYVPTGGATATAHLFDYGAGRQFCLGLWLTESPAGPCHLAWAVDRCGRRVWQACDPRDPAKVILIGVGP
jgi:hypothetical protein